MADDNSGATESAGISAATGNPASAIDERNRNSYFADVPEEQPPAMTEKERYWSAVRANPCDFDTWTYLLQVVESEASDESPTHCIIYRFTRRTTSKAYAKRSKTFFSAIHTVSATGKNSPTWNYATAVPAPPAP